MSNTHRGNTQPSMDQEEHVHISEVAGKKVFNIDSAGNVVNFSGVTVYQGDVPWASLGTTTLGAQPTIHQGTTPWVSLGTVTLGAQVTVHQGTSPWVSQATITAYGSQTNSLQQDSSTHALNVIDYEHHEIHSGSAYVADYVQDVANASNGDVLITTPDTTAWGHMIIQLITELETESYIYENPTIAASGATVLSYNSNRNSGNTAGILIHSTPSVTAVGTVIRKGHWGSGRGFGGAGSLRQEIILKQNEQYLVRGTNQTANNNQMWFSFDWYEHTDK